MSHQLDLEEQDCDGGSDGGVGQVIKLTAFNCWVLRNSCRFDVAQRAAVAVHVAKSFGQSVEQIGKALGARPAKPLRRSQG